jgi:hypothetical protein
LLHLSIPRTKKILVFPANHKSQLLNNIEYQNPNDKNSEAFFDNASFRMVRFDNALKAMFSGILFLKNINLLIIKNNK